MEGERGAWVGWDGPRGEGSHMLQRTPEGLVGGGRGGGVRRKCWSWAGLGWEEVSASWLCIQLHSRFPNQYHLQTQALGCCWLARGTRLPRDSRIGSSARARESRIGRKCFAQHPNQSTLSARHLGCPVQIAKLSVFWLRPMLCAEVEHRRQCMVRLASREVVALARPLAAAARIPVWASPRFFF